MCIFALFRAQINAQIQEKYQKFLLFLEQFYVFSFISLQIRCYNEMIFTFQIRKYIEEVISYKYLNFGTISCTNKNTNSRKTSKVFVVFTAVLCISFISLLI